MAIHIQISELVLRCFTCTSVVLYKIHKVSLNSNSIMNFVALYIIDY